MIGKLIGKTPPDLISHTESSSRVVQVGVLEGLKLMGQPL